MGLWAFYGLRTATLRSPLPRAQCCQRLHDAIDNPLAFYGLKPALGWVTSGGATLRTRKTLVWGLSVVVKARFQADGTGTLIHCRSRLGIVTIALLAWLCLWIAAVAAILVTDLLAGNFDTVGNLLVMMGGGVLLLAIVHVMMLPARHYARDDFAFLIDFIARTTEAAED